MQDQPARPVLKWAGGKTQLLDAILERLPRRIETYYEPFVGGGAVFFALAQQGRFRRAVLADSNADLIAVYRALKEDVEGVIRALRRLRHSEEDYYRIRSEKPRSLVRRAARTIFLNKTGYNGLYRVNSSGAFNVPFGRYKNPTVCDAANLRKAAQALAHVELEVADFEELCTKALPGDAVYLDPPYLPLSKTSSFTAYDKASFGIEEHWRLARCFAELKKRRVAAVLSNSDTPRTRRMYDGFQMEIVHAVRNINSKADKRGAITELLVCTRPVRGSRPQVGAESLVAGEAE
jgi:DNA adenine methylase